MGLAAFVPSVGDDIRSDIETELLHIEQAFDVTILFAVESGSRAWGFPSPDSDYDVRFVYAHHTDWYLSIRPGRDVIERPISDVLDIAGWDIKKALGLLIKPNPVMFEWLSSPIRYVWKETLCERLVEFSRKPAHGKACFHHHLNLGMQQYDRHVASRQRIKLKTYFYVLRPALTLRWIRLNEDLVPPMNLQALAERLDLDPEALNLIGELIARKAGMEEGEEIGRIPALDSLVEAEFKWAKSATIRYEKRDLVEQANMLFREILDICDPHPSTTR